MILFTNPDFQLDLSLLSISYTVRNAFLNKTNEDFDYSLPFKINRTTDYELFFKVLESNSKRSFDGYLMVENNLSKASLSIEVVTKQTIELVLKGVIDNIPGGNIPLKNFNFPTIIVPNMYDHAENVMIGGDTDYYVFPQIIKEYTDVSGYSGIMNYHNGDYNSNGQIICPFPRLKETLKHCVENQGLTIDGSFYNSDVIDKIFLSNSFEQHLRIEEFSYTFTDDDIVDKYVWHDPIFAGVSPHEIHVYEKEFDFMSDTWIYFKLESLEYVTGVSGLHASFGYEVFMGDTLVKVLNVNSVQSYNQFQPRVRSTHRVANPLYFGKKIKVRFHHPVFYNAGNPEPRFTAKPVANNTSVTTLPFGLFYPNHIDVNKLFTDITFGELCGKLSNVFGVYTHQIGNKVYFDYLNDFIKNNNAIKLDDAEFIQEQTISAIEKVIVKIDSEDVVGYGDKNHVVGLDSENANTDEYILQLNPLPILTEGNTTTGAIVDSNLKFGVLDSAVNTFNCQNTYNNAKSIYEDFLKPGVNLKLKKNTIKLKWLVDVRANNLNEDSIIYFEGKLYLIKEIEKVQLKKYNFEYNIVATPID